MAEHSWSQRRRPRVTDAQTLAPDHAGVDAGPDVVANDRVFPRRNIEKIRIELFLLIPIPVFRFHGERAGAIQKWDS